MNKEELIAFLKENLSIKVHQKDYNGYDGDSSYTEYAISLELNGEKIGDSETITVPM